MNSIKYKPLYYFIFIVFIIIGYCTISYYNLLGQWLYQTSIIKSKLSVQAQMTDDDVTKYLIPLNKKYQQAHCDETIITAMRIAEYHSNRLHEYGFLNGNKLICSTSVGLIKKPLTQPPADIISDISDIEFTKTSPVGILPGNEKAMRLKVGNFQALIKIDYTTDSSFEGLDSSIFVFNGVKFLRVYSNDYDFNESLMLTPSSETVSLIKNMQWLHQFCYAPGTCALIKIDIYKFIIKNILLLSITHFLLLILALALSFKVHKAIQRFYSFNIQVKRGMNARQIHCYYQPIINNNDNKISSCEVLCRWQDAEGNLHGAFQFINEVIKNGQETQLTEIIIKKSISEFKAAGLFNKMKLSINCFPNDVASGKIKFLLCNLLSNNELKNIVIEITEQQSSKESRINDAIYDLRELGVKIAIDDFGTGHSNLEQLKDLKVDYLKIDKGFILDIFQNKLHLHLVKHIVSLANEMDLVCVAEGVETKQHQALIPSLGIQFSQGFFHAYPMPIEQLITYLASLPHK